MDTNRARVETTSPGHSRHEGLGFYRGVIEVVRTASTIVVAGLILVTMVFWVQTPDHQTSNPITHLSLTYNTAVGMVDLYVRKDFSGFERLVEIDPSLGGVGGSASRAVALNRSFTTEQRMEAVERIARRHGHLEAEFIEELEASMNLDELILLRDSDPGIEAAVSRLRHDQETS